MTRLERAADWLGINRAALGVLVVIGCLGLAEEIWSNFVSLHLRDVATAADPARAVTEAAFYVGVLSFARNLLEGFGYIAGGSLAHRRGPRVALAVSAVPMAAGFALLFLGSGPWPVVIGALLLTNWEPLSVPATFDVIGSEVRRERRTIAFAVQSIQKRLPKVAGPLMGGLAFGLVGYWLNLTLAAALIALAVVLQLLLTRQLRPHAAAPRVPFRTLARTMPPDLRRLLTAEIFIRWGDWFARDFAVLYVVALLTRDWGWSDAGAASTAGWLLAIMGATALATYVPVAKWVDRSDSPKPFIATTFFLFSLFPICLVVLPRLCAWLGWPVLVGLVVTYVINGLREIGEPARKALISMGFPPETRARAVGLYWGLRSFAFCPAPLVAAALWTWVGPDLTFLIGGSIGLIGSAFYARSNSRANASRA